MVYRVNCWFIDKSIAMKKIIALLTVIALLSIDAAVAQVPGAFNFQGILRDADQQVIAGQDVSVRLSILKNSENGDVEYSEVHQTPTGPIGQITLLVGSGAPQSGSLLDIDWTSGLHYLKVEVDPDNGNNFSHMGTSQLVAVPYAMQAGSIKLPLENLEVLEPDGHLPEDALFEVKRLDGSTVFAVYNEGVRVYVDENPTKGVKGGFAVGGYTSDKGITNEYLRVTPDSLHIYARDNVRVFLDENPGKRLKGGFAVGGYTDNKADAYSYFHLDPINYFIGQEAGISNTIGVFNSFFGYQAGRLNTSGSSNFFQGYQSGYYNTEGSNNIFIGKNSGYENLTGHDNVFIGVESGRDNKTGVLNTFVGHQTGLLADSGRYNTLLGFWAGYHLHGGHLNTFVGAQAGHFAKTATHSTVIGAYAGAEKDFGDHNTFIGMRSGSDNEGSRNTMLGSFTGSNNQNGTDNVFAGNSAGQLSNGSSNVFLGAGAGWNAKGDGSIMIGANAGGTNNRSNRLYIDNWGSDSSMALIYGELDNRVLRFNGMVGINTQPLEPLHVNGNVKVDGMLYSGMPIEAKGFRTPTAFGASTPFSETGNYIAFGDPGVSEDFIGYGNNTFWLLDSPEGGDAEAPDLFVGGSLDVGQNLSVNGAVKFPGVEVGSGFALMIDGTGKLVRDASDARVKTAFAELKEPLEKVLSMKAYSFNWKNDPEGPRDVGFIAQEVDQIFPEVVYTHPKDGLMGINYSRIPALLVEAIKEQQKIIEAKDREIGELKARLEIIEEVLGIASE
jgi:hypothetical protein